MKMITAIRATTFGLMLLSGASCGVADDAPAPAIEPGHLPAQTAAAPADSTAPVAVPSGADQGQTAPGATPAGVTPAARRPSSPPRRVVVQGTDLTGIGYDVGSADAKVVVVNFSDFGCPFCGTFAHETYPALEREFVRTGKVFFKYVPFVMGMFPNAREATRAAECAAEQGKFWEMHDRIYADQRAWKQAFAPEEIFRRDAAGLRLDAARFDACYSGRQTDRRTIEATRRAEQLRVRATPSFFVNGRLIEGALPLEHFRMLLNELSR